MDKQLTLGDWREKAVQFFGAGSPAVEYLDLKITTSPQGSDEPVLAHPTQMRALLLSIHEGIDRNEN